jgi:hypothetical protein
MHNDSDHTKPAIESINLHDCGNGGKEPNAEGKSLYRFLSLNSVFPALLYGTGTVVFPLCNTFIQSANKGKGSTGTVCCDELQNRTEIILGNRKVSKSGVTVH